MPEKLRFSLWTVEVFDEEPNSCVMLGFLCYAKLDGYEVLQGTVGYHIDNCSTRCRVLISL